MYLTCSVYCNKCKKHHSVRRTVEVWSTPPILVIHIKRLIPGAKLHTMVDFPLENFDLGPYLASKPTADDNDNDNDDKLERKNERSSGGLSDSSVTKTVSDDAVAVQVQTDTEVTMAVISPGDDDSSSNKYSEAFGKDGDDTGDAEHNADQEPSKAAESHPCSVPTSPSKESLANPDPNRSSEQLDDATGGVEMNNMATEKKEKVEAENQEQKKPTRVPVPPRRKVKDHTYDLYAVINHLGSSRAGHYVTHALHSDGNGSMCRLHWYVLLC